MDDLRRWFAVIVVLGLMFAVSLSGQSLTGSRSAMLEQFKQAERHDFTRLLNATQLWRFVKFGRLVKLEGNVNYSLHDVSHPYTRPATKMFVERISSQYRRYCGVKLVVTSVTRPVNEQPSNASPLSVHPHGMSVDFRRPTNRRCQAWLENTLRSLERAKVLQATRERKPPHYHVAVYSAPYQKYVAAKAKLKAATKAKPKAKPTPKKKVVAKRR